MFGKPKKNHYVSYCQHPYHFVFTTHSFIFQFVIVVVHFSEPKQNSTTEYHAVCISGNSSNVTVQRALSTLLFVAESHFLALCFNRLIFQCAHFNLWHVSIPTFDLFRVQLISTSNTIIHEDDANSFPSMILSVNLWNFHTSLGQNEVGKIAQATNSLQLSV